VNHVRDYTVEAAKEKGAKEAIVMCHAQVRNLFSSSLSSPPHLPSPAGVRDLPPDSLSSFSQAYVIGFYEKVRSFPFFLAAISSLPLPASTRRLRSSF